MGKLTTVNPRSEKGPWELVSEHVAFLNNSSVFPWAPSSACVSRGRGKEGPGEDAGDIPRENLFS